MRLLLITYYYMWQSLESFSGDDNTQHTTHHYTRKTKRDPKKSNPYIDSNTSISREELISKKTSSDFIFFTHTRKDLSKDGHGLRRPMSAAVTRAQAS